MISAGKWNGFFSVHNENSKYTHSPWESSVGLVSWDRQRRVKELCITQMLWSKTFFEKPSKWHISKQMLGWMHAGRLHLILDNRNTVLTKEGVSLREIEREKESKTETQNARLRIPTGRTVRGHSHLCSVKALQCSHTSVTSSLLQQNCCRAQDRREPGLM